MNDILAKKCEDPIQFDKIKYMIHSLDKEKMNQIILEICEINPYLAVICHNTAEEDYSLKHAIVEKLKVLKIDTLHKAIVLCLACDATYVPPQCRGERSNKLQKDYDFTRRTCKDLIKIILKGKGRRKLAEQYGIDIDILDMSNRGFQNESSFWLDAFFRCIIRRYPFKLSKCLQKININKESYMAELIVACSFSRYAKRGALKRWLNLVDRLWV